MKQARRATIFTEDIIQFFIDYLLLLNDIFSEILVHFIYNLIISVVTNKVLLHKMPFNALFAHYKCITLEKIVAHCYNFNFCLYL
jgi:hypothetical protein